MLFRDREKRVINALVKRAITTRSRLGLLITGRSGSGKSALIAHLLESLGLKEKRHYYRFSSYHDADMLERVLRKYKVIVLDEIHLLKEQEILYDYLENPRQELKVIIMITNRPGGLKDALRNRAVWVQLEDYTSEELVEIFQYYAGPLTGAGQVLEVSRNPREIKNLGEIARAINADSLPQVLDFLGYKRYNDTYLNPDEYRYIRFLSQSGRVSEQTLRAYLGWDRKYLQEVEMSLLEKGLISITHRGREMRSDLDGNVSSFSKRSAALEKIKQLRGGE